MRTLMICLLLTACGRPLTPEEAAFSTRFTGPEPAQVARIIPDIPFRPERTIPVRPGTTCQERIWPAPAGPTITVSPLAGVAFNTIYIRDGVYETNLLPGYPQEIYLPDAMLLGHEMVHVWQWQNRETTGYHPLLALLEHANQRDPYLIDPETTAEFLSFGFEQQGSIMEEYICCRALAPNSERTQRLHNMLSQHFTLPEPGEALASSVRVPYPEVITPAICDP